MWEKFTVVSGREDKDKDNAWPLKGPPSNRREIMA
jgi:hypothetical protein